MTIIKDLAEIGDPAAIFDYIAANAVSITHEGKTVRVFNATRDTLRLGTVDEEIAVVPPSGYEVCTKERIVEDTHGTSNWVESWRVPTSDAVFVALGSSLMLDIVVIGTSAAAHAHPQGRVKYPIACAGLIEWATNKRFQWDRYGIVGWGR